MKFPTGHLLIFMVIGLLNVSLFGAQDFPVDFIYPSFPGDFYVSGNVSFPPGALKSEKNILIKSYNSNQEVPTKINIMQKWPDGSILSAEITFVANLQTRQGYMLSYGEEIVRKRSFSETAVLPTVSFSVGGAPKTSEKVNIDVGRINVRVDKSPQIYYYWHIIPVLVLIWVSYYRYRRTKRPYEI